MKEEKTSLWHLLEKYDIVIPIIQRDYVQGRKDEGKDELRNRFLGNLKDALEDKRPAKLDFVYGSVENGDMLPLDGQQRLTTLWLLHWYIAFRSGKLKEEASVRERLVRFKYTTRNSSEQFCRRLVDKFEDVNPESVKSVVDYISTQNWYYRSYRNDPTIKAMLVMLGGDTSAAKYPTMNGIEQFFDGTASQTYNDYWNKLTGEECPIQFYHKDMQDDNMPLTDDLYVKMNARGKQLTHFENFKAELVGYSYDEGERKDVKLFDVESKETIDLDFVSKLDNDWIRLFWPYKHAKYNKVDDIYFKFIRQYMLAFYFVTAKTADGIDKTELYKTLFSSRFSKIEDYAELLTPEFKHRFYDTMNGIVKYSKQIATDLNGHIKGLTSYFNNDFIPSYSSGENAADPDHLQTSDLEQIPFVLFYAICKFFEKLDAVDETSSLNDTEQIDARLKDWLRFCNNICFNPHIENVPAQLAAVKLIDNIAEKGFSLDIYGKLGQEVSLPDFGSKTAAEQVKEEWEKAKNPDLKQMFEQAEQHSFFNGSIRFLLWNEEGNYEINQESFTNKYKNAQLIFPADKEYTLKGIVKDSKPFQNYFNACHNLSEICAANNDGRDVIRFDGHGESWKQMLNNKNLSRTTHRFLTSDFLEAEDLRNQTMRLPNLASEERDVAWLDYLDYLCEMVFEDDFVKHLTDEPLQLTNGSLFLRPWYKHSLYPLYAKADKKVVQIGTSRNRVLTDLLKNGKISTERHIENSMIFWGWNIPFVYNEHNFEWTWDSQIILKDDNTQESPVVIDTNINTERLCKSLDKLCAMSL